MTYRSPAYTISRALLAKPSSHISSNTKHAALIPFWESVRRLHIQTDTFFRSTRSQNAELLLMQSCLSARRTPFPQCAMLCVSIGRTLTAACAFLSSAHPNHSKRKNRRAIPALFGDCAAVCHIVYALASVSMACAKILTLSMNFSQSIYSSGIWQVSVSPGKLMPKATVLGIMRE